MDNLAYGVGNVYDYLFGFFMVCEDLLKGGNKMSLIHDYYQCDYSISLDNHERL